MKRITVLSLLAAFVLTLAPHEISKAQVLEDTPPRDNFFEKENTKDRLPRPYVYVREADVYIKNRVWPIYDMSISPFPSRFL